LTAHALPAGRDAPVDEHDVAVNRHFHSDDGTINFLLRVVRLVLGRELSRIA
jgi:hypothetical protein